MSVIDPGAQDAAAWTELADRCWVRRYPEWDVSVGVLAGSEGLLVVDTRASADQGARLRDDVRRLSSAPVRWVVNTHHHFDHTFGNIAFDDATIWAHENCVAAVDDHAAWVWEQCRTDVANGDEDPPITTDVLREVLDTRPRPADQVFSSVGMIDLGDRYVELLSCGRGHTAGDIVVRAPDADVVFAGDLVEESGPPSYGPDCFPLEWPSALDLVLGVLTAKTVVVPGHGATVDRDFVAQQHADVGNVANTIAALVQSGVPVESARDEAEWPWDPALLEQAVRRGYAHASPPSGQLRVIE